MACGIHRNTPTYAGFDKNSIFAEIRNIGFEKYLAEYDIPIENAFVLETASVCCTDEGINEGLIRDPGGGTCHREGTEYAANIFVHSGITETTWHKRCAKMYGDILEKLKLPTGSHLEPHTINEHTLKILGIPPGNYNEETLVDAYAEIRAQELADAMNKIIAEKGIDCAPVVCSEVSALNRPKEYHNAQCVYINTTYGPFAPLYATGMPNGFGLSAAYFKGKDVIDNIKTVISIAFGPEGYKEGFTEENPFILAVIKDPFHSGISNNIKKDIRELIENPSYEHYGRVILDEFTAPKSVASICAPHHTNIFETIEGTLTNIEDAIEKALIPDEQKYPQGV